LVDFKGDNRCLLCCAKPIRKSTKRRPCDSSKIDGRIAAAEKLRLWSEVAPNRAFDLKVAEFDAPGHMIWKGGMPLGLFTGRRSYLLTPLGHSETKFSMREEFTGLFASMIFSSMPDLNPGFKKFAAQLKKDAEA
jgi:hypothetical protein